MSDKTEHQVTIDLEVFRQVCEHYRQDMRLFWTRSIFFLVVQGGLLSILTLSGKKQGFAVSPWLIVITGFAVAVYWFFAAKANLHWLQEWRKQVVSTNSQLQNSGSGWYGDVVSDVQSNLRNVSTEIVRTLPLIIGAVWLVAAIGIGLEPEISDAIDQPTNAAAQQSKSCSPNFRCIQQRYRAAWPN